MEFAVNYYLYLSGMLRKKHMTLILYTFVHVASEATTTVPKKLKNVLKSYQNS